MHEIPTKSRVHARHIYTQEKFKSRLYEISLLYEYVTCFQDKSTLCCLHCNTRLLYSGILLLLDINYVSNELKIQANFLNI